MSSEQLFHSPLSTFVIRLWREVEGGRICWRGRVQHVQSGESIAIADEVGLLAFLRRWVQMEERASLGLEHNEDVEERSVEDAATDGL